MTAKNITAPIIAVDRLRMSTDGNGVRTLIGFYGCPLRCKYCLNPQSWNGKLEPEKYTPIELYDEVKIDNIYFQHTNGGITFGGGEPLMHADFIKSFCGICPREWTFWAETSLCVPRENVCAVTEHINHFVVDIKTCNPQIYRAYTGADVSLPLENLNKLVSRIGAERITVRVPLIPGFTTLSDRQETVRVLKKIGITDIDEFEYRTDT